MKNVLDFLKQFRVAGGFKSALGRAVPAIALMAALIALYSLTSLVASSTVMFLTGAPALIVIIITALARVNDISPTQTSWHWHVRRFGLILVGLGALAGLVFPLFTKVYPSWHQVMLYYGIALTWFTTPGMPPWWRFIAGKSE